MERSANALPPNRKETGANMKAVVINCSSTPTHACYNLGARKLADWLKTQGYRVAYYDGDPGMWELDADLVALSVIFSWHAPLARKIALRMKDFAEVWCGGPLRYRHDWTEQSGRDFCRYFNRYIWRSASLAEYRPRKGEPAPFALHPFLY